MEKKKLTVVFVTNSYTPYAGGVVSTIKACVSGLQNYGHNVSIITLDFRTEEHETHVFSVHCPVHFSYKYGPVAVPWRACAAMEKLFDELRPDIVHVHHPFLLGRVALDICQHRAIPTVFTHHTQYDTCAHYVPLPGAFVRPVARHKVRNFCQRVNAIIAPGTFVKNRLQKQGIMTPIYVLPSPLLPVFSEALSDFVYKKIGATKNLLYVGRFTQEKNIFVLLQLIAQLPENFCLTLAGFGYLENELRDYAYQQLGLSSSRVVFVINPDKSTLCALYLSADLFVFSSITEGNPVVFAEAMACGTPIIALKGAWHSEQLVDGVNGFWVDDLAHMRERVVAVCTDEKLFKNLQHGAWHMGRNFCASMVVEKLEDVYCAVLAQKSS